MGQNKICEIENEKSKIRNLQMKNEKNEKGGGEKDGRKRLLFHFDLIWKKKNLDMIKYKFI